MTEVVWTFRRPWLFPCPFSVPLLSLGCLPSPYGSSLHHHCYLVKLKESSAVVKERADTAWVLTFIMVVDIDLLQDPLLLLSVICCSSPCHGSWALDCVCICVFFGRSTVLDVTLCWLIFSCSFLSVYNKTCGFGFPCWICQVHTRHSGFLYPHHWMHILMDFSQHICYRHSRIYSSGGMPLLE